jgi:predicted nuclease of predicted toxin-antitoxin system
VKLLFDENLSPKLVKQLADLYPDSNHVYHLGIDLVPDEEMREYARREGFVIVTKDSDFSDLCILLGFPPKVIWIRRGNCRSRTSRRYFAITSRTSKLLAGTKLLEF